MGERVTLTNGYKAVPEKIYGDTIAYGDVVASGVGFPSGPTEWIPLSLGRTYLDHAIGAITPIGCSAVIVAPTLADPNRINLFCQSVTNPTHGVNAVIVLPVEPWVAVESAATIEHGGAVWVEEGVSGYTIVDLVKRPIDTATEIELPGVAFCAVTKTGLPTMPEVFLRLWIELRCANGTTEGLDLKSIQDAALTCGFNEFYYNGDVRPDFLEAWLYQAAHSHGLRVTRTRLGIGFEQIGVAGGPEFLLTSVNSRDVVRTWTEVPMADREVRSVIRSVRLEDEYVDVGTSPVGYRIAVEELLGVRWSDTAHIESLERLWAQDRNLTQETTGVYAGSKTSGFNLALGVNVLIPSIGRGQFDGSISLTDKAASPGVIVPSWDSVLVSGYTDSIGSNEITDNSKDFTASVAIGDVVELAGSEGTSRYSTVAAVTQSTLTLDAIQSLITSSYRVFDLTPDPSWLLWVEAETGIESGPVDPVFDQTLKKVVYRSNITAIPGSALCIGKPKIHRITAVQGPNWTAIG